MPNTRDTHAVMTHRPHLVGVSPLNVADVIPFALLERAERLASYHVSEVDGVFVIEHGDGTITTDPTAVRRFITNTPKGQAMSNEFDTINPNDQYDARAIHDYDSADALLASYDPSRSAVVQRIGAGARNIREAMQVGRLWAQTAKACGVAKVTLDTDPEIPGRPQSLRPGTPQLHLMEVPEWHNLYNGPGTMMVVYYVPVTTWTAKDERISPSGLIETVPKELASCSDPSGFVAVVKTMHMGSPDQVDEWTQELRNAVTILSGAAEDEDPADIEARQMQDTADQMRSLSAM